ncbi:MAG: hypothetical protein LIR46_02890 [Bacteroidota bacterium]|nr:hypothetical protein [Bacteroidota bacterium]
MNNKLLEELDWFSAYDAITIEDGKIIRTLIVPKKKKEDKIMNKKIVYYPDCDKCKHKEPCLIQELCEHLRVMLADPLPKSCYECRFYKGEYKDISWEKAYCDLMNDSHMTKSSQKKRLKNCPLERLQKEKENE